MFLPICLPHPPIPVSAPGGWFLRLHLPGLLPAGSLIALVNRRYRLEVRAWDIFSPLPPWFAWFVAAAVSLHPRLLSSGPCSKNPALSGLRHLISSPCSFRTRVVSLPSLLVSGCLDILVYFPNRDRWVIPSWVSLMPSDLESVFCQDPDDTSSLLSSSPCLLLIAPCVSDTVLSMRNVFPWGKYYFINEKVDLAILKILSQVTQLVNGRVRIQTTPEPLFNHRQQFCNTVHVRIIWRVSYKSRFSETYSELSAEETRCWF